jgi:type IV secretory pathway VirB2 component (pilin)
MTNLKTISEKRDTLWTSFLALTLFVATLTMPEMALADAGSITETLCTLVNWMTGTTGRAVATLAIIIIGVGALMGKVSWGMAIIVALGVAIIFGAPALVGMLGGQGGTC